MTDPQGTKTFYTPDEDIHCVPLGDLREHAASKNCWCKPTEDEQVPGVWVHHSMDQRESYEEGRKLT
jgi:hypothetical protein